ncbi:hypothetical protein ES703_88067 [subsurface metagenome]
MSKKIPPLPNIDKIPPWPKGIEKIAETTIKRFYRLHKDGMLCLNRYCNEEEHDEYEVEYERKTIKKIVES